MTSYIYIYVHYIDDLLYTVESIFSRGRQVHLALGEAHQLPEHGAQGHRGLEGHGEPREHRGHGGGALGGAGQARGGCHAGQAEVPEDAGGEGGARELVVPPAFQEEAEREKLFKLVDINHNGVLSLAEIDKALPEVMGCVALFNAKPAIIRAFLAATGRPSCRSDDRAFREHQKDYVRPGEQFRKLRPGENRGRCW